MSRTLEVCRPLIVVFVGTLALGCDRAGQDGAPGPRPPATYRGAVERGSYLVGGLLQCFYCHSERAWDQPGAPITGPPGAGRIYAQDGSYPLVAVNLTPDDETGIGLRTDEELERAIRRGIGHDGRRLSGAMPFEYFRKLTDEDVAAVIAYLRSRDPVRNPLPPSSLSPERRADLADRPPARLDPLELSSPDPVELGRRLVRFARCEGCHTAWEAPRKPGVFGGGNRVGLGQGPAERDDPPGVFSSNLTPHPSGLSYDAETFITFMRTARGATLDVAMPWTVLRNLNDADPRAIYAFLQTLHPVSHRVNNFDEPTYCPVCGQIHGLEELNELYEPPAGLRLDPGELERYAGTFYSEEWDWTIRLTVVEGRLVAQAAEGRVIGPRDPALDVIVLSRTRLVIPEEGVQDVEFDADGNATRLVSVDVERDVSERVR